MFQRLTSECFEAVDWNAKASGDELEQSSSSFVIKHRHGPPEPLHDRRLSTASLQSSIATPIFDVDAAYAAHHYLSATSTTHRKPVVNREANVGPRSTIFSIISRYN